MSAFGGNIRVRKRHGILCELMTIKGWNALRFPDAGCMAELKNAAATLDWHFAKTMPQWPHWYIVRSPEIEDVYATLFHFLFIIC